MTPALLAALSSAVLPITWRFRATFTEGHVEALLDNLRAGIPLAASLRAALGPTLPRGTFRKRVHDEADAAAALADACAACPALRAEVEAAEAEGRARLRVEAECTPRLPTHDAGETEIRIGTTEVQVMGKRDPEGGEDLPRRFVDESGHTPQGATAEARAQEKATCPDNDVRSGMCAGGGKSKDEGPGALRAPEPIRASPVAHHHTLAANGSQPPGTSLAQPTASPAVAQAPAWREAVARSAALDAEAAPKSAAEPAGAYGLDLGKLVSRAAALAGPSLPISFGYLLLVDEACRRAGIPAMSPWWRWVLGRFHASLKRWGVFLVGRGGGKSTNLEKECASAVLFTPRHVFPGQTWTAPFISVGPDDANRRIFEIQAVLMANGVEVKPVTSPRAKITMTDVRGNAVEIGSLASTIGNMSGPSLVALLIDEAGKLVNKDGADRSANPLREIIISAASAFRARQGPRAIICSSAWECSGAHFELVEQGDNETNFLATIGEDFLDDARRGFELVALWEERGDPMNRRAPDLVAAAAIRAHAAALTAASPNVPTWVANPTLGNPEVGEPWEGAAVASRIEVQAIPEKKILAEGMPRWMFWLRECGSKPINRGGSVSNAAEQIRGIASALGIRADATERPANNLPPSDPRSSRWRPTDPGSRIL